MQNDTDSNVPVSQVPPSPPQPVDQPLYSYNQQNPIGEKRDKLPIDYIVVVGIITLSALYNFFAGSKDGLNAGNNFVYFVSSFIGIALAVLLAFRIDFARKVTIGFAIFNAIFYAFVMFNMANIQNNLSANEANYNAAVQKLGDKGITPENNAQLRAMNEQIETKRAELSKFLGVFYVVNTINVVGNVFLIGYFNTGRVKRLFTVNT